MVFSSPIFLFLFLPLTLISHFIFPLRARNFHLLLASLLFYFWGEVAYGLVVVAAVVANYLFARWIALRQGSGKVLACGVAINLFLLGWFKYSNFLADNGNRLASHFFGGAFLVLPEVHLPLGISFFTFHAISYLIDVKRGNARVQKSLADFALYLLLFPQLVAGPIIRYKDIAPQLGPRRCSRTDFAWGFQRFAFGLGKKMLLANPLGETADKIFSLSPSDLTGTVAWLGILAYSLQIYFDFSGYSDMAIGLMRMFGFQIQENFHYPYISRSVREFWRRWHISLSTWFRDYVYIPLGGNRLGVLRSYAHLLVIFLLCGLWHGASWSFLVWGLWHGIFLVLERTSLGAMLARGPRWCQHCYLLLVVVIGWVFFRASTLGQALDYLRVMAGFSRANPYLYPFLLYLDHYTVLAIILAAVGSTPVIPSFAALVAKKVEYSTMVAGSWLAVRIGAMMVIFSLAVCFVAAGTYNPFIYFRF